MYFCESELQPRQERLKICNKKVVHSRPGTQFFREDQFAILLHSTLFVHLGSTPSLADKIGIKSLVKNSLGHVCLTCDLR